MFEKDDKGERREMDEKREGHENDERLERRERARKIELRERAQAELLQQKLSALEEAGERRWVAGDELAELVEPADLADLAELVRLAAAVREIPHPVPESGKTYSHQQHILSIGRDLAKQNGRQALKNEGQTTDEVLPTQPIRTARTKPGAPAWPASGPQGRGIANAGDGRKTEDERRKTSPVRPSSFVFRLSLAALAAVLVLAVSLAGLGVYLAGPYGAQAATLMDAAGQVEVLGVGGAWQAVDDGDRIHSGERLRTGPASRATLVFFDGTRASLDPGSEVTLTSVGGDRGRVLRVALTQNAGKIQASVVPLRGSKSAFTVLTPSGAASVHGTTFDVAVDARGRSRFGVTNGQVLVSNEASEILLTAGQATAALPGSALEQASYQFNLKGTLSSHKGSTWIVEGVPFTVIPETSLSGDPQTGNDIVVIGRVLQSGEWIADSLELAPVDQGEAETTSSFTGVLEFMDDDIWGIGGWTIKVDSMTELGKGLQVGLPVRATFHLQGDGRWLAQSIHALQAEPEAPSQDPEDEPVLAFQPGELKTEVCGEGLLRFNGALVNTAGGEGAAHDVELAYQVVDGAEFVDWVELSPSKWERIDPGEAVNFSLSLALKGDWGSAEGPEDGASAGSPADQDVKLRVFVLNWPGARLTVKVENGCDRTETPVETAVVTPSPEATDTPVITELPATPTTTATPTITSTVPVTVTEPITTTPVITEAVAPQASCTGAQPHPTGMSLAQAYGVPYEEIMGWFCQGFGFGEIDLAYSLSQQSGKPVAEIFAMKRSGMGWGEIKKQLEAGPGGSNNERNPKNEGSGGGVGQGPPDHPGSSNPPGKPDKPGKPGKPNKP